MKTFANELNQQNPLRSNYCILQGSCVIKFRFSDFIFASDQRSLRSCLMLAKILVKTISYLYPFPFAKMFWSIIQVLIINFRQKNMIVQ